MPSEEENYRVNWETAFDYMQQIQDPVAKNLIGLVYQKILRNEMDGVKPAAPFDLLYCFRMLHEVFGSADLYLALQSEDLFRDPPDWI
jgi:hypothetical protein